MTDTIYPAHPALTEGPAPINPAQAPNPYQTAQTKFPMPQLPQSFQPNVQAGASQGSVMAPTPAIASVEVDEKILQDVSWSNFKPVTDIAPQVTPNTGPNTVPNTVQTAAPSPAYPPMPGTVTPSQTTDPSSPFGLPPGVGGNDTAGPVEIESKSLVAGIKQRFKSEAKAAKPKKVKVKKLAQNPAEVAADMAAPLAVKKPRSAMPTFMLGLLAGGVLTYVVLASLGKVADQKEYAATVAAAKAEAAVDASSITVDKVEDINDGFAKNSQEIAEPELKAKAQAKTKTKSKAVKARVEDTSSAVFLDEQLEAH